ncbi:hypothetical protein CRENBAI_007850 [Crenichthys baileyi]|uniref:Uncharacterized protein n=1 Tax=Crenichthys baileyi TaxID=28760 RepID=A0AAV9RZP6_9TELE
MPNCFAHINGHQAYYSSVPVFLGISLFTSLLSSFQTNFPVCNLFLDSSALPPRSQSSLKNSTQDSLCESPHCTSGCSSGCSSGSCCPPALYHLSRLLLEERTRKFLPTSTTHHHLSLCWYIHHYPLKLHHLPNSKPSVLSIIFIIS